MSGECPPTEVLDLLETGAADSRAEEHVRSCAECRARLEEVRSNNRLLDAVRTHDPLTSPLAVGHDWPEGYRVLGEIHRGSQGVVYLAEQTATHRRVALKLLHVGRYATTPQRRRFERELDLVARLEHPNIVTVHDGGRTPAGGWFIAMQHVTGTTLDEHLSRRGPPRSPDDVREIAHLFVGVCAGVAHAHRHRVVHHDLKPENVIVDGCGAPHIVDFGLARAVEEHSPTRVGEFAGTLAYAAPEQVSGHAGLDVRTDVYALGAMLYEALAGRRAVDAERPLAELVRAITDVAPAPIGEVRGDRAVATDVQAIVSRALEKSPDRRYDSAGAMQADLERFLSGLPIEARPATPAYLLYMAARRHRVGVAIAAAFVVLLSGFAVAMSVAWAHASLEADKANQIRVFLEDTLASVGANEDGSPTTVRQALDEAVHWIDQTLGDRPEVEASLRHTVGNSFRALGELDLAEPQLVRALELRERALGPRHLDLAASLGTLGLLRRDQGRLDEASSLLARSLAILESRFGPNDARITNALSNLASVHWLASEYGPASALLVRALDLRLGAVGPDHPDSAMILYQLARVEESAGDLAAAARYDVRALAARLGSLPPDHPDVARSISALERTVDALEGDERRAAEGLLERALRR